MNNFFNIRESKDILRIKSNRKIYKLIGNGSITAVKVGRFWMISQEEINRIMLAGAAYPKDKSYYQ